MLLSSFGWKFAVRIVTCFLCVCAAVLKAEGIFLYHGQLLYRWKCRTGITKGLKTYEGPILREKVIQNAVVKAIRQTICNPGKEYEKLQNDILTEISDGNDKELKQIND